MTPTQRALVGFCLLVLAPSLVEAQEFRFTPAELWGGQAPAQEPGAELRGGQAPAQEPGAELWGGQAPAQEPGAELRSGQAPSQERAPAVGRGLLVFLDCDRRMCDDEYLRREITFINYVRDRQDAQVHILVTSRRGSAGEELTFQFIGLREFAGDDVEHVWVSSNTNTQDERREGVAQMIRVGILHYLAKTPLINQIEIRQQVQDIEQRFLVVDPDDDPWDFWVMRASVNGTSGDEDRRSNRNVMINLSANRTTEAWKIRVNGNLRYNDRKFVFDDGRESLSVSRQMSLSHQTVKSLGGHWGLSFKAAAMQATFVNIEKAGGVAPGIEYNIFPYEESSRRTFTLTYELSAVYYDYYERTIFAETEELLYDHGFEVDFSAVQPWGQANFGIESAQFLDDLGQWRFVVDGRLDFRITRGLSFNVRGNWAAIRDQRFLAAGGQSDEEILLELRALATDTRHEVSFGLTYTFGSIFNNVINTRFTGDRGDFSRFF
jgi:hypothetical protein